MALIELHHVRKEFSGRAGKVTALGDIDLTVGSGDIYGTTGYSGVGKNMLVHLLNELETPTEGEVKIQGQDIILLPNKELRNFRKEVGIIFQHFNLLWSRTVLRNIMLPSEIADVPGRNRKGRAEELIKLVDLEGWETAYPSQLSGRRKQRVGIARALTSNPDILLCDEATSALGPQTTDKVSELLLKINQELNLTIVLVTHEMYVIRRIYNRVAVMEYGKIVEEDRVVGILKEPQIETAKHFTRQEAGKNIEETELVIEEMLGQYPNGKIVHLSFHGEQAKLPTISHTVQEYQVEVNIIQEDIQQTKQGAVDPLYIQLLGEEQNTLAAIKGLHRLRVETEVIGNEWLWLSKFL